MSNSEGGAFGKGRHFESAFFSLFPSPPHINKTLGQMWNVFWIYDSSCVPVYTLNWATAIDVAAKIYPVYSGFYICLFGR